MNQDSDDKVINLTDSDDEKEDDELRALTPNFTLDHELVIDAFRLKISAKSVILRLHDILFTLQINLGKRKITKFFTLPWVLYSLTRNKSNVKSFSMSAGGNLGTIYRGYIEDIRRCAE